MIIIDNKKYRLIIEILSIFSLGVIIYDQLYNEVGKVLNMLSYISISLICVFSYIIHKKSRK